MSKFTYLLPVFMLASASICHAQEGVRYGYCSDDISGFGFNSDGKYWIAAAFQLTEADVAKFDGCEITGVSVGFGSGRNKDIEIFMTEDLKETPFFTQAGRVRASQWCDIPIAEPVRIEKDKPIYIGYTYYVDNMTAKPVGADDNTAAYTPGADWMAAAVEKEGLATAWQQYGQSAGNVCIRAIISGDNLSDANCIPFALTMPEVATPGEPFDFTFTFTNASSVPVNDVDVVYQLGTDPEQSVHYVFDTPVAVNERGDIQLNGLTDQDALEIPSWARIVSVNGKPNDMADRKATATLVCTTGLFERKVVVEKITGTYCGYCPRGIAGFDYLDELHPGSFIGIAVHNYANYEPMYCTAYDTFFFDGFGVPGGAPSCYVNRNRTLTNDPAKSPLEAAFQSEYSRSSNIGIIVSAEPTSNSNAYDATATVKVARTVTDADYSIVFVVTEDFVGPYLQANNYNASPGCPEFSGKGGWVDMLHNDVARNISSEWNGIPNSVPTLLESGKEYPFTVKSLSLGTATNPKNANIIALLIDNKTQEIANADRLHLDPERKNDVPVSVEAISAASSWRVLGGQGCISVEGEDGTAYVYTTSGQLAATVAAGSTVRVAPGLYLVKTPAGTQKTIVK